jgi:hypothetical protein
MTTSTPRHGMRARVVAGIVAGAMTGFAAHASGQTVAGVDWHRGTTLGVFLGAASSQSVTDAAAGVMVGWELTPHLAIEGRGLWLDAGPGADAFTALLGARVPFLPGRLIGPFVSGGAGLYRATSGGGSFDDFDFSIGAGADIALGGRLALRPEVTVLFVTRRPDTRAIPVFGAQLAYHFESHPITPARPSSAPTGRR